MAGSDWVSAPVTFHSSEKAEATRVKAARAEGMAVVVKAVVARTVEHGMTPGGLQCLPAHTEHSR